MAEKAKELTGIKTNDPERSKEKRIENELKRISLYFEEIDGNQLAAVTPLLQNAAFMMVTLQDLQEQINAEGVTETYTNGANQRGVKSSAALQSYNSLIKNYASVIKALAGLLPPERKAALQVVPIKPDPEEERRQQEERNRRREEELARAIEYQRRQRAGVGWKLL